MVALLIGHGGCDLDARDHMGWTPLHYALLHLSDPLRLKAVALIEAGADVRAANDAGWTPLHVAACFLAAESVKDLLVARGADPNAITGDGVSVAGLAPGSPPSGSVPEDGTTPLHIAAEMGFVKLCPMLLHVGWSGRAQDARGRRPVECFPQGDPPAILQAAAADNGTTEVQGELMPTPLATSIVLVASSIQRHFRPHRTLTIVAQVRDALDTWDTAQFGEARSLFLGDSCVAHFPGDCLEEQGCVRGGGRGDSLSNTVLNFALLGLGIVARFPPHMSTLVILGGCNDLSQWAYGLKSHADIAASLFTLLRAAALMWPKRVGLKRVIVLPVQPMLAPQERGGVDDLNRLLGETCAAFAAEGGTDCIFLKDCWRKPDGSRLGEGDFADLYHPAEATFRHLASNVIPFE